MNAEPLRFVASAPRGLADLLARELLAFGASDVRERSTGVSFMGSLEVAYRACLGSRTANRVFLELGEWDVTTADEFYAAARRIDWSLHFARGATLACDFSGRHPAITHTHFGALKLKDAIVDSLRDSTGFRPDISTDRPSVRVHAHAQKTKIAISLDLSGESLHRRGYRGSAGEAPLKENVAAGVLLRAGWPELAATGAEFLDPMCGSGTFVIEAALIAADIAPGLAREYFGFQGWRQHDADLWSRLRSEAQSRVKPADSIVSVIRGQDRDPNAIRSAGANSERAGVDAFVRFSVQPLDTAMPALAHAGLLAVNPPYGVRLEDHESAKATHRQLGEILRTRFQGWSAAILTAPDLGLELGIRAHRAHTMWNGALECRLLRLKIEPEAFRERITDRGAIRVNATLTDTPGARMFANRLAKNLKQVQKWARSEGVTCFRVYDADMPEYAFAIDSYTVIGAESAAAKPGATQPSNAEAWLHVQEYAAPASIDEESVRRRRAEAFSVLPEVTGVAPERIRVRVRKRQTRGSQYQKVAEQFKFHIVEESVRRRRAEAFSVLPEVTGVAPEHIRVRVRKRQTRGSQYQKVAEQFKFHIVEEGGLKFRVNFDDYLDTGLFLDHRPTRARIREIAAGKRFLNLFSYTGTVTVHAAAGGARSSVSVDLSRTYLDWAERNLALNALATRDHQLVQADCREWLEDAARGRDNYRDRYDLIFLDPPTFSNSKRMEGVLDIARDHAALIDACMPVLAPGGLLVFSTNAQKFKLDPGVSERYDVQDISAATVPRDFARNPRIHRCYDIRKRDEP